ncbi:MAG: 6-hydroxymethylpterin diphosphokinase MptE-like protein [Pseudodesulfovibrio sp.]
MLNITCENKTIRMSCGGRDFYPLSLDLLNIYGLDELLAHAERVALIGDGIDFRVAGAIPDEAYGLYMELLRQVLYLHTTHCMYPRLSSKAPSRGADATEDFEHYLNSLKNMPFFSDMCHCQILKNYCGGAPLVIVSPGPSLDVELLRRLKGRAYILAIGRTLPRLVAGGVVPDFLYIQDTSARAWRDIFVFDGCPDVLDTAVIANPAGYIHEYARKVRHIYKSWNYFLFEKDVMPKLGEIAPSSTSGAFSLAMVLGAGEIVLMGNDCGGLGVRPATSIVDLDNVLRQGFLPKPVFAHLAQYTLNTPRGLAWMTSDYLCALQWLKTRIFAAAGRGGVRFYDNSATGFLRDTGLVAALPEDYASPSHVNTPLPRYTISFHPEDYLKKHRGRFGMLRRCIRNGNPVLPVGLERPFNAVFCGIPQYAASGFVLDDRYNATVLDRIDRIIDQLDSNMAMEW